MQFTTFHDADRQYENRFEEKCKLCGERNLWRTIEWANTENALRKKNNEDPIIIKYCRGCRDEAKNKYDDRSCGS